MRVTKEQVLAELRKHPRGATNSMIAAALDATDSNVSSYMGRLVRSGLAIETGERRATGRGAATGTVFKAVEQPSAAPPSASARAPAAEGAEFASADIQRVLAEIRASCEMLPSISAKLDGLTAALNVHAHATPPPFTVEAPDAVVLAVMPAASVAPPSPRAIATTAAPSALGRHSALTITTMQLEALVAAASVTQIGPLPEISDSELRWLEARRDLAVSALKNLCEDWTAGRGQETAVKIAFARWKLLSDYTCYHDRPQRDGNFAPLDLLESWRMLLVCACDEWSVAQAVAATCMLFGTCAVSQLPASSSIEDLTYQLAEHRGALQSFGSLPA